MRYAFFDAEGRVSTAHNDDTMDVLPAGAVGLTDAMWDRRFDLRLVDDALIDDPVLLPEPIEQLADAARARRDALITATDYLLMPDYPISAEQLAEVRAYRQALRDIPLQAGFPQTIDWPAASADWSASH